jgi:hypothetical protein
MFSTRPLAIVLIVAALLALPAAAQARPKVVPLLGCAGRTVTARLA